MLLYATERTHVPRPPFGSWQHTVEYYNTLVPGENINLYNTVLSPGSILRLGASYSEQDKVTLQLGNSFEVSW